MSYLSSLSYTGRNGEAITSLPGICVVLHGTAKVEKEFNNKDKQMVFRAAFRGDSRASCPRAELPTPRLAVTHRRGEEAVACKPVPLEVLSRGKRKLPKKNSLRTTCNKACIRCISNTLNEWQRIQVAHSSPLHKCACPSIPRCPLFLPGVFSSSTCF